MPDAACGAAGREATWTVLGPDHGVVGPAEEFLEYLRVQGSSPNTVKSYARALALWWSYLSLFGLAWDTLTLSDVGGFLPWLRSGDGPVVAPIGPGSRGSPSRRSAPGCGR